MFYDLNVKRKDVPDWEPAAQAIVGNLAKLGYRGIAITTDVSEAIFEKSKKEGKQKDTKSSESIPTIPQPPNLKNLRAKFPKVRFYSRINISISDSSNIRKFVQCKELRKYDLISVQPESQSVIKSLTGFGEVDIISYNPESKCQLLFNRKLYNQFVNQNVYFELTYSPAIADSTARRNLLSLSHIYRAVGKSKNIIVTSGVQMPFHVRGPYDVINFNILFGLSEELSKNSISRNCEKLILRARKQRRSKSTIEMVQSKQLVENNSSVNVNSVQQS